MEQKTDIDQLIAQIFAAGRMMRKRFNESGVGTILSLLQVETLRFVDEKKDPTMKQIADFLAIAAPSATSLVEDMVKRGYLDRTADATDRRKVRLAVSKTGKTALNAHLRKKMTHMKKSLGRLSSEEQAQLLRILIKLSRNSTI